MHSFGLVMDAWDLRTSARQLKKKRRFHLCSRYLTKVACIGRTEVEGE